jgi:hypothetical protein
MSIASKPRPHISISCDQWNRDLHETRHSQSSAVSILGMQPTRLAKWQDTAAGATAVTQQQQDDGDKT